MIYLIGSLSNDKIPDIENKLRENGYDAFAQWFAAGPDADSWWKKYFGNKGYTLAQMLKMAFVQTAFNFDKKHLDAAAAAVLILPAGKSGHLELGYMLGKGKPGFILLENEPDRVDLMYGLATGLAYSVEELCEQLAEAGVTE